MTTIIIKYLKRHPFTFLLQLNENLRIVRVGVGGGGGGKSLGAGGLGTTPHNTLCKIRVVSHRLCGKKEEGNLFWEGGGERCHFFIYIYIYLFI